MTTDCTPRYCYADPYEGGKQAIAEAYRNLCAVGAKPLAVTNCLNFANPQRPEIMAQIVGCLEGMGDACRALDFPIVSGNVSLYNESKATGGGSAILPTPAIGGVGLIDDHAQMATIAFKDGGADDPADRRRPALSPTSASRCGCAKSTAARKARRRGSISLHERRNGEFVRELIAEGHASPRCTTCPTAASWSRSPKWRWRAASARCSPAAFEDQVDREKSAMRWSLFAENQGATSSPSASTSHASRTMARTQGVGCCFIGWTGGDTIKLGTEDETVEAASRSPTCAKPATASSATGWRA